MHISKDYETIIRYAPQSHDWYKIPYSETDTNLGNTYYMTDFFKPDDDNYYNGWYDRWGRTDYVVIEDGTIVSLSLNFS